MKDTSTDNQDQTECSARLADTAWRATQASERAWIAAATRRTPTAWRRAIDSIGDKRVRVQVACVVWWSFFGPRPASNAWHHLDDYLDSWTPDLRADPTSVRAALIQIGFPQRLADWRVKINDPKNTVSRGNRRVKS